MNYLGFREHNSALGDPPVPKACNLARVSVLQDNFERDRVRIEKQLNDVKSASEQSTSVSPPMECYIDDELGGEVMIWMALQNPVTNRPLFFLRHQRRTFVVHIEFDPETHRRGVSGKCLLHRIERDENGAWLYGLCLFYTHGDESLGVLRRSPERLRVYHPQWVVVGRSTIDKVVLTRISPTRFAIRNQVPFVVLRYNRRDFTLRDAGNSVVRTIGPGRYHLGDGVFYFCRDSPNYEIIRAAQASRPALTTIGKKHDD